MPHTAHDPERDAALCFRVSGVGVRVSGFGFGCWASGFESRVSGFGCRVRSQGFTEQDCPDIWTEMRQLLTFGRRSSPTIESRDFACSLVFLSDTLYQLKDFRKSSSRQNRPLVDLIRNGEQSFENLWKS